LYDYDPCNDYKRMRKQNNHSNDVALIMPSSSQ